VTEPQEKPGEKRRLSTHVLDTARGRPAAGVVIELYRLEPDGSRDLVVRATTNADGRTDRPLLADETFVAGSYEMIFEIGDYFRAHGVVLEEPAFLESVPIRFHLNESDPACHVPLVCSPWSYATYRGS
jgi:5-hydroxyisourate hydrolase